MYHERISFPIIENEIHKKFQKVSVNTREKRHQFKRRLTTQDTYRRTKTKRNNQNLKSNERVDLTFNRNFYLEIYR